MNGRPAPGHLDASALQRELTRFGVVVLAVIQDPDDADRFIVYLHGPAGELHQRNAVYVLRALPTTLDVQVSDQTPSIVLVYQRSDLCG